MNNSVSLCGLPTLWWDNLCSQADDDDVLALAKTSKALRSLALSHRQFMFLKLNSVPEAVQEAGERLQVAISISQRVALSLDARMNPSNHAPNTQLHTAEAILANAVTARRSALTSLVAVELKAMPLDALVPAWVTSTCVNIKELCLTHCTLSHQTAVRTIYPLCPHLKRILWQCHPTTLQYVNVHQLQSLPGLSSLAFSMGREGALGSLQQFAPIGSQITQLQWKPETTPLDPHMPLGFAAWFPQLHSLVLRHIDIDDTALELLLSMAALRHFACHTFILTQDHTHRMCPWIKLGLNDVDISSLSRLPWDGIKEVQRQQDWTIQPSHNTMVNRRMVATLIARGWLQAPQGPHQDRICINTQWLPEPADENVLAVLPLLTVKTLNTLLFEWTVMVQAIWAGVRPYMQPMTAWHCKHCSFLGPVDPWPGLLSNLPGQPLACLDYCQATEEQLTAACVHVKGPIKLLVRGMPDWEEMKGRIRAAMTAAGHQHVTLQ